MDLDMERVLFRALKRCCQYMRKNPPGDLDNLLGINLWKEWE